jgi:predicted nuclease of predicted toxin-antitoxin system
VKLKLDENIGQRGVELLRAAGHDVATVRDEMMLGAKDSRLFAVCASEGRVLITLDRDFGNVLRFPPAKGPGLIVLEIGAPASSRTLLDRIGDVIKMLEIRSPAGDLWIVEPGRVRMRERDGED